jgi:serine/threonine-protein kinase
VTHRWPHALPGGKAFLFETHTARTGHDEGTIVAQDVAGGARHVLQEGGYHPQYAVTGQVLYMRDGTLFAVRFDPTRLELQGGSVPIASGVYANTTSGWAHVAISKGGTLAYLTGGGDTGGVPLYWVNAEGQTTAFRSVPTPWSGLTFSPDGRRLAFHILDNRTGPNVWVYDLDRDTPSRLTFESRLGSRRPVWTPDGRRLAFATRIDGGATENIFWQPIDGSARAERLTESPNNQQPTSWHPNQKVLAFNEVKQGQPSDIWMLPFEGSDGGGWKPGKPVPFQTGPFAEDEAAFSPDGRWVAYSSNESGMRQIYVRPYPGPGGKWMVSTETGSFPTWSKARPELFYGTADSEIMVVRYTTDQGAFRAEQPRRWTPVRYRLLLGSGSFALHPDGKRMVMAPLGTEGDTQDNAVVVLNFSAELQRVLASRSSAK